MYHWPYHWYVRLGILLFARERSLTNLSLSCHCTRFWVPQLFVNLWFDDNWDTLYSNHLCPLSHVSLMAGFHCVCILAGTCFHWCGKCVLYKVTLRLVILCKNLHHFIFYKLEVAALLTLTACIAKAVIANIGYAGHGMFSWWYGLVLGSKNY